MKYYKVNDIRAAAKKVYDEFSASVDGGVDCTKAFKKFRGELVRVYGLYCNLADRAQASGEKALFRGEVSL